MPLDRYRYLGSATWPPLFLSSLFTSLDALLQLAWLMPVPSSYENTTIAPRMTHSRTETHQRTAPRPILKRVSTSSGSSFSSSPSPSPSMKVHFPPHASLTQSFAAYSPAVYDRTPIRVAPNLCELPERGCPGRTYDLDEDALSDSEFTPDEDEEDEDVQESTPGRGWKKQIAAHAKRRVRGFDVSTYRTSRPLPPVRALSFETSSSSASEELDELGFSPFLNGRFANMSMSHSPPKQRGQQSPPTPTQLSFLPHPRSHSLSGDISHPLATYPASPRKPSRSTSPTRIRKVREPPARARSGRRTSESSTSVFAEDEGCLGGF